MKKGQRVISQSFAGAADDTRDAGQNLARASQIIKADDLIIRIDRPLPPPEFVSDATCEAVLGIDCRVFRRVAKRIAHRREHGVFVVERTLIVAELRRTDEPARAPKPKAPPVTGTTAVDALARAGFRRVS